MGIAKRLKEENKETQIYGLEPDTMSLIKSNIMLGHKIEGIGDEFIPSIVDTNLLKDVILINDEDSINMSKKIAKELGLGVGISSGANFLAAVIIKEKIKGNVVTIFPDDLKKYLSIYNSTVKLNQKNISNKIKLISYETL